MRPVWERKGCFAAYRENGGGDGDSPVGYKRAEMLTMAVPRAEVKQGSE